MFSHRNKVFLTLAIITLLVSLGFLIMGAVSLGKVDSHPEYILIGVALELPYQFFLHLSKKFSKS
ncbi:hypothetical protein ACVR05_01795 [Streptococcus caprae]|uniref:Uncharacterized protein n=1 Tax=Streptococcus caprae TaxID=1640501 RepID=A0ABV8CWU3_9STRE